MCFNLQSEDIQSEDLHTVLALNTKACRGVCVCVVNIVNPVFWDAIHTCFDGFQWNLGPMMPSSLCICHRISDGVKGHVGVIWGHWTLTLLTLLVNIVNPVVFGMLYTHALMDFNETWVQWCLGVSPNHWWGQRSSRGQRSYRVKWHFPVFATFALSTCFDGLQWDLDLIIPRCCRACHPIQRSCRG